MVVRKRRKKNKVRGNRTHSWGGTKNRRGSGFRGGVGRAGSHKHKFSKYYMDFGVKSTFKPKAKKEAVNLETISGSIEKWVAEGKAKIENGFVVIDGKILGFGKVLGKGGIKEKIKLENAAASKSAAKKIISAGGSAGAADAESAEDEDFEAEEENEETGDA